MHGCLVDVCVCRLYKVEQDVKHIIDQVNDKAVDTLTVSCVYSHYWIVEKTCNNHFVRVG